MDKFKRSLIKVALISQLLILLFAVIAVSAASLPQAMLAQDINVDGSYVEAGTLITVKLDGMTVSETTIDGDNSKLLIPDSDYDKFSFYVNGVEADPIDVKILGEDGPAKDVELTLKSKTSDRTTTDDSQSTAAGGGGGGMAAPPGDQDEVDGIDDTGDSTEESVLPSPGISDGLEETDEISAPVPTPEGSSVYLYALVLLLFMVLIAVGVLRYK